MLTNTAVLATQEPPRYTLTLYCFAAVDYRIRASLVSRSQLALAFVKTAVETLNLVDPKLKVALARVALARKGDLRWATWKLVKDADVGNVAHLMVVEHGLSTGIASHVVWVNIGSIFVLRFSSKREASTGRIDLAYYTVNM